jgi:hypothetical protein
VFDCPFDSIPASHRKTHRIAVFTPQNAVIQPFEKPLFDYEFFRAAFRPATLDIILQRFTPSML